MGQYSFLLISLALIGTTLSGNTIIKAGEYHLEWEISQGNITVTATAKTLGSVNLGFSPYGSMMEADIIISGSYPNGTGYIRDSWAFADSSPPRDTIQNVELISATENATHTTVTWTRQLDTGDVEHDRPIQNETTYIIWAWGPTDTSHYHGPNRGTISLNLIADA